MGQDPSTIREELEQTRERMGDTVEALAYKADVPGRAKDGVNEKIDAVRSKFTGMAGKVDDRTPDAQDVKQGARQAVGVAQENPLGLAIGAMAAGFLAGMLLPSTRVENERLGPMADEVKEQARETVQTVAEHGREAAQDVAQAVKDTGGEHVQQAVSDVKDAAQQAGQEHAEEAKSDLQDQAESVRERAGSPT